MHIIQSIILGVVEGITEFLPVSSTGHLILASTLLHIEQTEFVKSFEIIIQLGAMLAVVVLYWKKLWRIETIKKFVVAFIPTGIIGLLLYKVVKTYLVGNVGVVIAALFIGGIALIIFERLQKPSVEEGTIETISYKQAFLVGIFQAFAIIPGVSRSAATIVGGLSLGLARTTIVEFSFLLAVPTMLAATGLDLLKSGTGFSSHEYVVLGVGFFVSFGVALLAIRFLLRYVTRHSFTAFGWYRILIALIAVLLLVAW